LLKILIIADDLTGAADCGAAFAAKGLETVVVLEEPAGLPEAEVISYDANTRAMTPEGAVAETRRIVRENPADVVYKKIDSTLRGYAGVEIAAALEAYRACGHPEAVAVVTPAFPAMGRTVRNGRLYVHGELMEDRRLEGILDAETDDDLRAIVGKWIDDPRGVVWAGSAGLAGCLAGCLARCLAEHTKRPGQSYVIPRALGPIVFAVGTASERSREQVETLKEAGVGSDVVAMGEAGMVAELVARYPGKIGGLVVTGGETARAVLTRLGVRALRVAGEVEMGVPILVAEASGMPVITKAGDFGDRETFLRCRAALRLA
jgi:4-hydroxythreonine-4-phosphate dehydrogenase